MNSHNAAILAGAVVAAMAIIAIAFMIPHTSGDVGEDADIVGHWYLVRYEYYDGEGTEQARNISVDPEISLRDLDIYTVSNGMFNGFFLNTNISGVFFNGDLDFGTFIGDTRYTAHGNLRDDGHIKLLLTETVYRDDGTVDVNCYDMTYTASREIVDSSVQRIDVSGRWTSFHNVWYDGTVIDMGTATAIVSQSDELLQIDLHVKNASTKLEGALTNNSDGTVIGYLMDSKGYSWRIMLHSNGSLELGGAANHDGTLGTVTVLLSRNGAPVGEQTAIDLQGTTWRSAANNTWDMFGNSISVTNKYYLEFTEQNANSVLGFLHSGPNSYPIVAYLCPGPVTHISYTVEYEATSLIFADGWITGDQAYTSEIRYAQDAMMSSLTMFEKISNKAVEHDITGHWYVSTSIGYEDDDRYVEYDQDDRKDLGSYDLDIYELRNGLLFGRFLGANVTGSYIGGVLDIVCDNHLDGGTATIEGWIMDDNTLTLNEAYTMDRPEGYMYYTYSTIMSRDGGASINEEVLADMVGGWRLHKGYIFNGTTRELSGMALTVDEYRHNVFYGTISQVIGYDIVDVGVRGVLTSNTQNGEASGLMIGSSGAVWHTYLKDGAFTAKFVSKRTLGDTSMMATSVCVYVKAESNNPDPVDERTVDIVGTWKASSIITVMDTGIWNTEDFRYVIDVEAQNGVSAVGSGHQPGLEGRFSLVMTTNVYGDISLVLASDYGLGEVDRGMGWIDESDPDNLRIYIVETYLNVGGHWTTQMTCFERYMPQSDIMAA